MVGYICTQTAFVASVINGKYHFGITVDMIFFSTNHLPPLIQAHPNQRRALMLHSPTVQLPKKLNEMEVRNCIFHSHVNIIIFVPVLGLCYSCVKYAKRSYQNLGKFRPQF